jgi:hypothetical protein
MGSSLPVETRVRTLVSSRRRSETSKYRWSAARDGALVASLGCMALTEF